jgi:GntR family transcriptional repressor for pyruvate dehydrogenase complex
MPVSVAVREDSTHFVSRSSAVDQIADDLREQIVSGSLPRGTKLPSEKELCASYGVSAITVRAALRSLATMNLIEVRHGIGSFVTVATDELLGSALGSIIRIDRIGASEILAVLGSLNGLAAELAATNATGADLTAMETWLDTVDAGTDIAEVTDALTGFLDALASASGNPLLESLCRFLGARQISLARDLAHGDFRQWLVLTSHLRQLRRDIVQRIRNHDAAGARAAAVAYHASTSRMISGLGAS